MTQLIRIEKRLPFGFRGEWGKVYKLFTRDETTEQDNVAVVEYQKGYYADIGQDVQFKHQSGVDKTLELSQTVQNLVNKGEYRLVETTDAYFDTNINNFKCVVALGDIVEFNGEFYVCEKIEVRNIVNPAEQCFYYLGLKKIYNVILTGVQNA